MAEQAQADVVFECQPHKLAKSLAFSYSLANRSKSDLYVLDAFPAVEPGSKRAFADLNGVFVSATPDGAVYLLKGIPPLPADRQVWQSIIPLGSKLAPEGKLGRNFEIPLPLAEQSPYYVDLPLRDYQLEDVRQVTLIVHFLRSTVEGFKAEPVDYAEGFFRVSGKNTMGQVESVASSFPTKSLTILMRKDRFARFEPPKP